MPEIAGNDGITLSVRISKAEQNNNGLLFVVNVDPNEQTNPARFTRRAPLGDPGTSRPPQHPKILSRKQSFFKYYRRRFVRRSPRHFCFVLFLFLFFLIGMQATPRTRHIHPHPTIPHRTRRGRSRRRSSRRTSADDGRTSRSTSRTTRGLASPTPQTTRGRSARRTLPRVRAGRRVIRESARGIWRRTTARRVLVAQ
jgi:hypothetical protein